MAIALDDLGAHRIGVEVELREDLGLDVRAQVAVRPDRPRDLAGGDLVDGLGQAAAAAIDLERPAGELQTERDRLRVDAVGPAHHQRVGLAPRSDDQGRDQAVAVAKEERPRVAELEGERGVDDVAARQAEMEIAALRPDRLRDLADERDDVVVGRLLDLGDPVRIDGCPRLDRGERVGGDGATGRLGAADRELDAEHRLEPGALRPDRAHLRERVALDHDAAPVARAAAVRPMSWRRWRPGQRISSAAASAARRASSDVSARAPRPSAPARRSSSSRRPFGSWRRGRRARRSPRPPRCRRSHRRVAARLGYPSAAITIATVALAQGREPRAEPDKRTGRGGRERRPEGTRQRGAGSPASPDRRSGR